MFLLIVGKFRDGFTGVLWFSEGWNKGKERKRPSRHIVSRLCGEKRRHGKYKSRVENFSCRKENNVVNDRRASRFTSTNRVEVSQTLEGGLETFKGK